MSNQDANDEGDPYVEITGGFYPQTVTYQVSAVDSTAFTSVHINVFSTNTLADTTPSYTAPATLTTGQTLSYSFNPYPSYDVYWGGDERKSIPHLCRCNASMSHPHEDQIYIKKMWFCSVKCYEEWMVACIGTDIDER